jgi:hypothetical protein
MKRFAPGALRPGSTLRLFMVFALALAFAATCPRLSRSAPGANRASGKAHTFHASLAQVEFNPGAGTIEIAIRLFTDDLEKALSARSGRRIRMDVTPGAGELTLAYLRDVFELKGADGQPRTLSWVGAEATVNTVWVYVEAKMPEGLGGARLKNQIFFELFGDQVNTVNVKQGGERASLAFQHGDGEKVVEWKQ